AAARCGACGARSGCPPRAAAGGARSACGGHRRRRWGPSCSSTPAPSHGSRGAARCWPCMVLSTTPLAPAWPCTSARPRTCTATPPSYGLPLALYGDRLGVFVRNDPHWPLEEELRGTQDPTHFGRILPEAGIGDIAAHSPQAKGRIERFWQTLQDRLVSELRLRGICTSEAANAFLPEFLADLNPRFAPAPAAAAAAWRPAPRNLAAVLSCRYTRTVARDNTVHLGPRWVQLPRRRSYAGRRVELREGVDGRLLVFTDGACVATQPAPAADFILRPRRSPSSDRRPRRRASERPGAEGGRSPPTSPNRPSSPRPRLASPARTPHPSHPWRHSTPYSPRPRG